MRHLTLAVATIGVLALTAAECKDATPEQRAARIAARQERVMKLVGGHVLRPGKGRVVVADCGGAFHTDNLLANIDEIAEKLHVSFLSVELKDATFSPPEAVALMKRVGGDIVLFYFSDPAYPISLVAPEAAWAAINVAALKADSPDEARLKLRCRKMFARVMTQILGAPFTLNPGSPMQPVTGLATLDTMAVDRINFTDYNAMLSYLPKVGVTPSLKTTYKRACQEGWAPAPTNQWQQAVWDDVHRIPGKPLQIKYDPGAGR